MHSKRLSALAAMLAMICAVGQASATDVAWSHSANGPGAASFFARSADGATLFEAWCTPDIPDFVHVRFGDPDDRLGTPGPTPVTIAGIEFNGTVEPQLSSPVYLQLGVTNDVWARVITRPGLDLTVNGQLLSSLTYPAFGDPAAGEDGPVAALKMLQDCAGPDAEAALMDKLAAARRGTDTADPADTTPATPRRDERQQATRPARPAGAGKPAAPDPFNELLAESAQIIAKEVVDNFFTEAPAPDAPGGRGRVAVTIASVRAIETTFGFGGDEIFLLGSDGTRIPANGAQDIDAGETWSPNAAVTASGGLSFDLREWDSISASDQIGNFTVPPDAQPGRYTATLRGDGAVYEITYDVARPGRPGTRPPVAAPQPARPPAEPRREWATNGTYAEISVTDCRDCGEDVGIAIQCRGDGLPALVSVPWLGGENGPEGLVLPLELSVDGRRFTYDATISGPTLVGFMPQFFLNPHDPAIDALMAGSRATISFDGNRADFGLRGSRVALTVFEAHCGWTNAPVGTPFENGERVSSAPAQPDPPMAPTGPRTNDAPPDFYWFAGQYRDESDRPVATLSYGIPETDAIGFSAICRPGGDGMADVSVNVGLRTLQPGDFADIYIQPGNANYQYRGTTFSSGGEFEGIETRIALSDPVWQAMAGAQSSFLIGAYGGNEQIAAPISISSAISGFLASCQAPAERPAARPAHPDRPGNRPERPNRDSGAAGSAADGSYACNDGSTLLVSVTTVGRTEIANVIRGRSDVYALQRQEAQGRGMVFSTGEITLQTLDDAVMLIDGFDNLLCQRD